MFKKSNIPSNLRNSIDTVAWRRCGGTRETLAIVFATYRSHVKLVIEKFQGYILREWAEGVIKVLHYYGIKVRFIRMAPEGGIEK